MASDDAMGESGSRMYGSCEGPEAMYVKLISSDGHEFIVRREHALTSGTIKVWEEEGKSGESLQLCVAGDAVRSGSVR